MKTSLLLVLLAACGGAPFSIAESTDEGAYAEAGPVSVSVPSVTIPVVVAQSVPAYDASDGPVVEEPASPSPVDSAIEAGPVDAGYDDASDAVACFVDTCPRCMIGVTCCGNGGCGCLYDGLCL